MTANDDPTRQEQIAQTARRVMPGGGLGNVTYDIVIAEGRGSHVWDVDGREYIDYILGSGPMLIGHADPEVLSVIQHRTAK